MKKVMAMLLSIIFVVPAAFAATSTDINNQKNDIQTKYDNEKNSENQSYDAKVAEYKQNDQNDPNKLNNELKELQIDHNKKIDDLSNNEKMELQKVDGQNKS